MGELHLDIIIDRLKREFSVDANVGKPQVSYRETISGPVEQEYKYVKQSGGKGQFGHVFLRMEPQKRGAGFEFVDEIKGGVVPKEFIPAVQRGIEETMRGGVLAGYPVVDVKVSLYDGSFHDVDSSEFAFKAAAAQAFREGARSVGATLLEPVMAVEVNSRRGVILGMDDSPSGKVINAEVPLAEMFGYATALRSATQGRAAYTMQFKKYASASNAVTESIVRVA